MKLGQKTNKHGLSYTRFYRLWITIKSRCYCKNHTAYHNYGGRGIKMCASWKNNVKSFVSWCETQNPDKKATIDRKDNNGPYSPANCQFLTRKLQLRNRRLTKYLRYNGRRYTVAEFVEKFSVVKYEVFYQRAFILGWDFMDAARTPVMLKTWRYKCHK